MVLVIFCCFSISSCAGDRGQGVSAVLKGGRESGVGVGSEEGETYVGSRSILARCLLGGCYLHGGGGGWPRVIITISSLVL